MFNMTIEEERALLSELGNRRTYEHPDKSHIVAVDSILHCPNCHVGEIVTKCIVERYQGQACSWRYLHQCNNCGVEYDKIEIATDIRLRTQFDTLTSLGTPFGTFHVLANGREIPFRYRRKTHDIGEPYGQVHFHEIDIDVSTCSVGEMLQCRFEDAQLERDSSDENAIYVSGLNNGYALMLMGFDPELEDYKGSDLEEEMKATYPYDFYSWTPQGLDYIIERNPQNNDVNEYYLSRYITLTAAWVAKPYEPFTFNDEVVQDLYDRLDTFLVLYI